MGRIVMDAELRQKLAGCREPVEFVDEDGGHIGIFRPTKAARIGKDSEPPIEPHEWPPYDGRWVSSEQVLAELRVQ